MLWSPYRLVFQLWPSLKVGVWGHLTICHASGWHLQHFVSWWHLSISAISDQILIKLFEPNFLGVKKILDHHFVRRKLLESKIIWTQNYLGPKILGSNICGPKLIWIQNFILTQLFFTQNFLDPKLFEHTNFLDTKCLCTQNFVLTYHADFLWFNLNISYKTIKFSWVLPQLD